MESELYKSIFAKGEAQGEARAEARGRALVDAKTIFRILSRRLGTLDPALSDRIQGMSDRETLTAWYDAALEIDDTEGAQRLAETIRRAPFP